MKINTDFSSPNVDQKTVEVQFLVLHYTGCSFEKTMEIFQNPSSKVSSHFVIDTQGIIYELIPSLSGKAPLKAYHAGDSQWKDVNGKLWNNLNSYSLGIELVNNNGNLFPYTPEQYKSLIDLVLKLKEKFPALCVADSVLGHEHIAGFRGKVDPGMQFDWNYFFKKAYDISDGPSRSHQLPSEIYERFQDLLKNWNPKKIDWAEMSALMEEQCQQYLKTN